MDAKTLQALEASIRHWEDNVKANVPLDASDAASDCALCSLFFFKHDCQGCPIQRKTHLFACEGSPYNRASNRLDDWHGEKTDENRQAFQAAAQEMLDFLISLRPEKSND